jgi:PIN domain nuclease of toxin-antitoxin system
MKYVVDTHAPIWFLTGNARLGPRAKAVLDDLTSDLILPATALAEACWIVEHGRTPIPSVAELLNAVGADGRLTVHALDRLVVEKSNEFDAVREMHDRQIAATAAVLMNQGERTTLLTYDADITAAAVVPTLW